MEPIIYPDAKVLILGSIPGVESLLKQQYYANARNHFWRIIYALFDQELEQDYEQRLQFLKAQKIALWDVIETCQREGSLDSNIRDAELNDIRGLLANYPSVTFIGLNGTKAFQLFVKHFRASMSGDIEYHKLPSSSPVPGRNVKSFEEKKVEWSMIKKYLN